MLRGPDDLCGREPGCRGRVPLAGSRACTAYQLLSRMPFLPCLWRSEEEQGGTGLGTGCNSTNDCLSPNPPSLPPPSLLKQEDEILMDKPALGMELEK